jgi:hypothetical protein
MLSVTEQLTYSTARIECDVAGGLATGTGFFFRFLDDGQRHVPVFVTNKHVVEGAARGRFYLTNKQSDGGPAETFTTLEVNGFASLWIGHPDQDVDLCVFPLAPLLRGATQAGNEFFYTNLDPALIPTADDLGQLTAVEDVIMIGYPNGIWDSVNNAPIVRRGVTATHPNREYEGRSEFMIDAACFPGSSGSPVLLCNLGGWPSRDGAWTIGSRVKFLGVLHAGPQFFATGEIGIVDVPTIQRPVASSAIPMNLGLVIKARRLMEFEPLLRARQSPADAG